MQNKLQVEDNNKRFFIIGTHNVTSIDLPRPVSTLKNNLLEFATQAQYMAMLPLLINVLPVYSKKSWAAYSHVRTNHYIYSCEVYRNDAITTSPLALSQRFSPLFFATFCCL